MLKINLLLSLTLSGLFLLLAATVHAHLWFTLDWAALTWLQSILPRLVDLPFSVLSLLGSVEVTTIILVTLVFISPPRQRIALLLAFGTLALIEIVGKSLISQPIPPRNMVRSVHFFSLFSGKFNTAYAFPSGHSARTMFLILTGLSLIAASQLSARKKYLLFGSGVLIAAVMLVSRVYLVEHWLSDVIGGALLGSAVAILIAIRRS